MLKPTYLIRYIEDKPGTEGRYLGFVNSCENVHRETTDTAIRLGIHASNLFSVTKLSQWSSSNTGEGGGRRHTNICKSVLNCGLYCMYLWCSQVVGWPSLGFTLYVLPDGIGDYKKLSNRDSSTPYVRTGPDHLGFTSRTTQTFFSAIYKRIQHNLMHQTQKQSYCSR